jgi:predicted phosphoribosyltransferase
MEPHLDRSGTEARERAEGVPSTSPKSREEAGARLAERLARYRGANAVVVGIARGGVRVAAPIARVLEAELDVIVARRLIIPGAIESVGAVTADGCRFLNTGHIADAGASSAALHRVTARETAEASRREAFLRGGHAAIPMNWRQVILVDDGLDSGATIRAALRSIHAQQPERVTVAIPVGSRRGCAAVRDEVDELVCLDERDAGLGLSVHQRDPTTATDAEVRQLLADGWAA